MSDQNLVELAVNQPYPMGLPLGEGAISDFLRPASNRLLIVMPDITESEARVLRNGEMRGGMLSKNGAILFLWQFGKKGKPIITLDSPFDIRSIQDIQLYNIDNKETRLVIDVHIVDSKSKMVRGLRSLTMPPGFSIDFLCAVQDQISSINFGETQHHKWMALQPCALTKQTQMWLLGR